MCAACGPAAGWGQWPPPPSRVPAPVTCTLGALWGSHRPPPMVPAPTAGPAPGARVPSSGHSGGGRAAAPAHLCRPAGPSMASWLFGRPHDSGDTELPCLRVRTGLGPPQGHPSLAPTPSKVLRVASLRVRGWVHLRWASAASPPASEQTGDEAQKRQAGARTGTPPPPGGRHGADRTRPEPAGLETRASSGIRGMQSGRPRKMEHRLAEGPASGSRCTAPEVGTPCPQPHRSRGPEWKPPPESGNRGSNGPDGVAPRRGHRSALGRRTFRPLLHPG